MRNSLSQEQVCHVQLDLEINHLKTVPRKNNYSSKFIKSFLNKLYTPKDFVQNVPQRNVFIKLPFLEST